jgi:hypothetical protein
VSSDYRLEINFWEKMSTASLFGLDDDLPRLAVSLRDSVETAFRSDPVHRFEVASEPGEKTLILELALVEVVPNKSMFALGALASMGAAPAIGMPIGVIAHTAKRGTVAIEGRVRDSETGELVAMFADRETSKTRVVDIQSVRWYGHAYEIFDEWAVQLVAVTSRPAEPGIADPLPFAFQPW